MKTVLGLIFFSVLLTPGLSLTCVSCEGPGNTCLGPEVLCPASETKCGITLVEGTGVLQVKSIIKSCIRSLSCEEPYTSVSLGKEGGAQTHITCCEGNSCQDIIPTLPPLNTMPNGRRCPTCYAEGVACNEKTVECTGDQFYCVQRFRTVGEQLTTIIKGCANRGFCMNMLEKTVLDGPNDVVMGNCSRISAAARVTPELLRLFLPVVAGLLLLKAQD